MLYGVVSGFCEITKIAFNNCSQSMRFQCGGFKKASLLERQLSILKINREILKTAFNIYISNIVVSPPLDSDFGFLFGSPSCMGWQGCVDSMNREATRSTHCNTLQHTATHCNTLCRLDESRHCKTQDVYTQ